MATGLGNPNSSVRNSADSRLSRAATMVWLNSIGIVLPVYFGAVSSKAMLSGSRNSRMYDGPMSLIGSWSMPEFVEMRCRSV